MTEFVASGSLVKERPEDFQKVVAEKREKTYQFALTKRLLLERVSVETEADRELVEIVRDNLPKKDFPPVYFLDRKTFKQEADEDLAGRYLSRADAVIVAEDKHQTPVSRLGLLLVIAHEVCHSQGRYVFAIKLDDDNKEMAHLVQGGEVTIGAEETESSLRGQMLNEELKAEEGTLEELSDVDLVKRHFENIADTDYSIAKKIVSKVAERLGDEAEKLLVDSMSEKGGKTALYRRLVEIYGHETAKEIVSVPLETKRLRNLLDML